MSKESWWSREIFRGPATWKVMVACAFGTVFLAGMQFGRGRSQESAIWLVVAAAQLGVAYYGHRGEQKRRR